MNIDPKSETEQEGHIDEEGFIDEILSRHNPMEDDGHSYYWHHDASQAMIEYVDLKTNVLQSENQAFKTALESIRHATYARDTDDAILHEIGEILTQAGFPYENED